MKKIVLALLTVALFSCEKEVNNNQTNDSNVTYVAAVTFDQNLFNQKTVTLNGVEKDEYTFNVTQGDVISIEAWNNCQWSTGGGGMSCDEYTVRINVDGNEVASQTCECETLELEYTIE